MIKLLSNHTKSRLTIAYGLLGLLILLNSCREQEPNDPMVAKVYDKELRLSEIQFLFKESIPTNDSLQLAQNYINKWIREQLKLQKAEAFLKPNQKELQKQIENYRKSLMIHQYEQELIRQRLDTIVFESDLLDYYDQFSSDFFLNNDIVKLIYAQLPKNTPDFYDFRNSLRNFTLDDGENIREYCDQFAVQYQMFDFDWVYLDDVIDFFPEYFKERYHWRITNDLKEYYDGNYYHFMKIYEHKPKGNSAPLELVANDIKNIILLKRKKELIKKMEKESFDEAMHLKHIQIFKQ